MKLGSVVTSINYVTCIVIVEAFFYPFTSDLCLVAVNVGPYNTPALGLKRHTQVYISPAEANGEVGFASLAPVTVEEPGDGDPMMEVGCLLSPNCVLELDYLNNKLNRDRELYLTVTL